MPRRRPLTEDELFAASRTLREVSSLEGFNRRVAELLRGLFECNASACWHLAGGRLGMETTGYEGHLGKYDVEAVYGEHMRLDPAALRAAGLMVSHISDIYRHFEGMNDLYARFWAELECDHQIAATLFEDDVFAGVACAIQKLGSGDFTHHDVDAMHAIYPHLQAGYLASAAFSRTKWFGAALAYVIDEYETPLFIVAAGDDRPVYANRAARRFMQSAQYEGAPRIPVAACSRTAELVVAAVNEGRAGAALPAIGSLEVIELPDWPRLGLERPRLVLIEPRPAARGAFGLTDRQVRIVTAAATAPRAEEAAVDLGITVSTLQTHLKRIYRKLGVSGLSEALVSLRLGGAGPSPSQGAPPSTAAPS